MAKFPVLKIRKGKERSLFNQHPWVFSGAVAQLPNAPAGSIVSVESPEGIWGYGFYEPESQITCRLFHFCQNPVGFEFDAAFWVRRFQEAWNWRKSQFGEETDSYRIVFSESDGIPGLIADVYGGCHLVVQTGSSGAEKVLNWILPYLKASGIKTLVHHPKPITGRGDYEPIVLWGQENLGQIVALENGIKFYIDPINGQKTGFFLDQREPRALVKAYSKDKRVLNTFSYSGGFSLYALSGGASEVMSVDISRAAIDLCEENLSLNPKIDRLKHKGLKADCFEFIRKEIGDWDLIVLDPPALAKKSFDVEKAARGYKELNRQALMKMKKGALLFTFSCSQHISKDLFRKIVFSAAADAQKPCRILHQLSQGIDHPISIFHPESEYLKGLVIQITE